jgi:hypothetical protein
MGRRLCGLLVTLSLWTHVSCPAADDVAADDVAEQLAAIARSGPQGAGSATAQAASQALAARDTDVLPRLLRAMETENPVAANWYRSAYETIVERELARPAPSFPVAELQAFVVDAHRQGRVRRLVLALCDRLDPQYSAQTIPRLLDDPEFRDDAVERALAAGQKAIDAGDSESARHEFRQAFEHSRDGNQTARAAARLAGFGEQVDIAAHLGLVVDWWLVGPFDAPRFSGFARELPPEQSVELRAKYTGQDGGAIGWIRHRTADLLGLVNLVAALAPCKEAVGYAYAQLVSPDERAAQLRCGADDCCRVWLNGQQVFSREQWLNGIRFDRFTAPVRLRRGTNELLVKVCQGPPNKDPQVANNWSLQLRFCDEQGQGLPLRSAPAAPAEAAK